MKRYIKASHSSGYVSIWWYTDNGEFWDYTVPTENAVDCNGYLQASDTKNHMNLWRSVVKDHISDTKEQEQIISKGFKSLERGRIIFNVRTQCYEIICSETLANVPNFRSVCKSYFNITNCRCEFIPLHHYNKQELTGNPAVDALYYD